MSLLVAKSLAVLGGVNGLCMWIFPKTMLSLYNAPTIPKNVQLYTVLAASIMSYSVMASYTLNVDANINQAVALAQIPWILQSLRSLFIDQNQKRLGESYAIDIFPLLLSPWFVYTGWNDVAPATLLFGMIQLVNGVSILINPDFHTKVWTGNNQKSASIIRSSQRTLGFAMLGLGTFVLGMHFGLEPTKAFGYSWISFAGMSLFPFLTNDVKKHKLFQPALLAFFPIHLLAVMACCW
jgi:hypothetical protein